jgi:hypothetical protein
LDEVIGSHPVPCRMEIRIALFNRPLNHVHDYFRMLPVKKQQPDDENLLQHTGQKGNTAVTLLIIGLILAALLAFVLFFLYRSSKQLETKIKAIDLSGILD